VAPREPADLDLSTAPGKFFYIMTGQDP